MSIRSDRDAAQRTALVVVALIAVFVALKLAEDILAPMVLAIVTGVILSPLSRIFERLGMPKGLVASSVVLLCVILVGTIAFLIEPLIWRLVEAMPKIRWELRDFVDQFRDLIRGLSEVNQEVEEALGTSAGTAAEKGDDVAEGMPKLTDALFFAPVIVAQALVFLGTLFFFLLTRRGIYDWVSDRVTSSPADAGRVRQRFGTAESLVSRYFLTVTVINIVLGSALAGALMIVGLPAPLVWGIAAAGLNYLLYLGPMVVTAGLLLAGIVAFDGLMAVVPPLIFLCLNLTEGQFLTPALVGRHMSVNPLLVFVSLVVWLWLWGPIGGIIAIPVLVITLAMLDIFDTDDDAPDQATD
ncbi:AI-2E family transporter [Pseudohalocynthiibacter aestuariivivens]|nr:AI-2E family transporter [Pseudohalocynthiibacter aestuariivivens]QIE47334.1 AI-2E family transporter [Pseudohalocynthiibacter aestuariivivens]